MSIDKNALVALTKKIPNISKSQELPADHRLVFLYFQLNERKKVLYRAWVDSQTGIDFTQLDDSIANDTGEQRIKETTAQMKGLKYEIDTLNRLITEHIEKFEDLSESRKTELGII